jgi:ribokinase
MSFDVVCVASWNADLVSRVPRPIARGETLHATAFEILPGGKGSNAAVACARQGARVALVARIGDDAFGRLAMEVWKREGIDTAHVEVSQHEPSGVAQILVYDDGDNSIAVAPGANAGLSISTIPGSKIVVSSCEVPLAATQAAFELARKAGATTILNPAPARPLPDELISLCDLLVPNEAELKSLPEPKLLFAAGVKAVVVTLGARGCALLRPNGKIIEIPGHAVKVVDTVGAGDTFVGALAAALARGEAPESALAWANAAAALSVTGRGALGGMPTRDAVAALLG